MSDKGKSLPFGFKRLMTFMVYGLLLLLFFNIFLHWHRYIASDFVILSSIKSDEAAASSRKVLHGFVERQLSSGRLPVTWNDKRVWQPWASDPPGSPCFNYTTRFTVKQPQVWLLSFPCSGNTWTRYLLESASGIFTGSIYRDTGLVKGGFLGDGMLGGKTLVVKTHRAPVLGIQYPVHGKRLQTNVTHPTVLLIRNPAKAMISFFKFKKGKSHVKQIPEQKFNRTEFHDFVKKNLVMWLDVAVRTLEMSEAPVHVMHYERLVQNPLEELTKVLAFLGVPRDEGRMACIASHLEGNFKRKDSKEIDPYTLEEKVSIVKAANAANRTLQVMGYPPLPSYN